MIPDYSVEPNSPRTSLAPMALVTSIEPPVPPVTPIPPTIVDGISEYENQTNEQLKS